MDATFCSLEWKKREAEYVEKKPSSFSKKITRKDGSVVYMIPQGNVYILTVKSEDGRTHEMDVYGVIKHYAPVGFRITKNFRENFEKYMSEQSFSLDKVVGIKGVYAAVNKYFS